MSTTSEASKTERSVAETLAAFHGGRIPEARTAAEAICQRFLVFERPPKKIEPPAPAEGQLWRNKQSNRLVRIRSVDTGYNRCVFWEVADGSRGVGRGRVWLNYWASRFEFVATSDQPQEGPEDR